MTAFRERVMPSPEGKAQRRVKLSQPAASVFDVLSSGQPEEVKALRDEFAELDFQLRQIIDKGLPVDEFPVFQGLQAASEAAVAIIDSVKG
jgi:hypothetical protein